MQTGGSARPSAGPSSVFTYNVPIFSSRVFLHEFFIFKKYCTKYCLSCFLSFYDAPVNSAPEVSTQRTSWGASLGFPYYLPTAHLPLAMAPPHGAHPAGGLLRAPAVPTPSALPLVLSASPSGRKIPSSPFPSVLGNP